ncbi:MAG: MgtC/SapB family protein [Clostridiales bacterium]|nr:MgtC/SapB family protein [Clostridiales bacterium]MBR4818569.1 MgtC/SapB family protein [Clostridiales bacterium]MBR5058506.1 MgtC/SapB family protein [Clostridiales bacterium]
MLSIFDGIRDITLLSTIIRLFLAVLLGGAIGIERSYKNRPAGFRTHILVCIGAAIASMTGIYLYLNMKLPTDISRLGAQVVSGLGFIGGGTIIVVNNRRIKGLTTAAGLWACGIIGLAIGAGFYEGAILATVLVLLAETWFSILGSKITHNEAFQILLEYNDKNALNDVMRYCKDNRMVIANLAVTGRQKEDSSVYSVILTVRPRSKVDREKIVQYICELSGVIDAEIVKGG